MRIKLLLCRRLRPLFRCRFERRTSRCTAPCSSTTTTPSTRRWCKFEELVKKYYGKTINFVLHRTASSGLEKDYFAYMTRARRWTTASSRRRTCRPSPRRRRSSTRRSCSATSTTGTRCSTPTCSSRSPTRCNQKAEVMLIGYAGGGTRNIFVNKPVRNLAEMKGLKVRVQGAPIWSKTFAAVGMAPTVIAYNEIYNAIQNGVISAGENEAAGVEAMKFYEVGAEAVDDAARHHHPADLLLGQDLQEAATRTAGRDPQGRQGSRRLRPAGRVLRGRRRSSTRWRRRAS